MSSRSRVKEIQKLQQEIELCRECWHLPGVSQIKVCSAGNLKASIMLVGEGPGEEEEQERRPFIGPAGRFLRKTLAEIGFPELEQNFFITNIVRHRAYRLDSQGRKRNRPPSAQQIAACRPFLAKEIEIIQPKLIITLGAIAAQWFLGKNFKLTKNRGKIFFWQDIPVLPTFHPSAVRRGFERKLRLGLFKKDLSKISHFLPK